MIARSFCQGELLQQQPQPISSSHTSTESVSPSGAEKIPQQQPQQSPSSFGGFPPTGAPATSSSFVLNAKSLIGKKIKKNTTSAVSVPISTGLEQMMTSLHLKTTTSTSSHISTLDPASVLSSKEIKNNEDNITLIAPFTEATDRATAASSVSTASPASSATLQRDNDDLRRKLSFLVASHARRDDDKDLLIESLRIEVEDAKEIIEEKEAENSELKEQSRVKTLQIASLRMRLDDSLRQMASVGVDLHTISNRAAALEIENGELRGALDEVMRQSTTRGEQTGHVEYKPGMLDDVKAPSVKHAIHSVTCHNEFAAKHVDELRCEEYRKKKVREQKDAGAPGLSAERLGFNIIDKTSTSAGLRTLSTDELTDAETELRSRLAAVAAQKTEKLREAAVDNECVICNSQLRTIMLQPCGHFILCVECFREHDRHGRQSGGVPVCPQCRTPISGHARVYK